MKKQKIKIKPLFKRQLDNLINYKAKMYYYFGYFDYKFLVSKKVNRTFSSVVQRMQKHKAHDENVNIIPTMFNIYLKDSKIQPFWNKKINDLSNKLFMPTNNNMEKTNVSNTLSSGWFECTQYISNKSCYSIKTKPVSANDDEITKCRKIKLYFNKDQRKMMKRIIGTYRYFYNRCVSFLNNYNKMNKTSYFLIDPVDKNSKIIIKNIENPYNFIKTRKLLKTNYPNWILENFPSHLIDQAIAECINRFNTCLSNCIKKKIAFYFKYKSKAKDNIQTINLEKTMICSKTNGFFSGWKINGERLFKNVKSNEKFNKYDFVGSTLSWNTKLNNFHLNLVYKCNTDIINKRDICAIDQGTRPFATVYYPSGVTEIGQNAKHLYKICTEIDIIKSRMSRKTYYVGEKTYTVDSKRRKNLQKALHRKIEHLKNQKKDLHKKTSKYLCDNFEHIILPPFKTQEMAGKLHSKIARQLYNLSFYEFSQTLINKANSTNRKVHRWSECYTSMTCGNCGKLKLDLGSSKIYDCNKCKIRIGRDINGARNILLKNIWYI